MSVNNSNFVWKPKNQICKDKKKKTIFGTAEGDDIKGSQKGDYINGKDGNDILFGGDRSDIVIGGNGIDGLYGDDGNDFLFGGNGIDFLYGAAGNDYLSGGAGDDLVADDGGNDTLDGGYGNDFLDPGPGYDLVIGGAGDDIVTGGVGPNSDTLIGGPGKDLFIFVEPGQGIDKIVDFNPTDDAIIVNGFGFGGGLTPGSLSPSQFVVGDAATTADHRFIYNNVTGGLFFDPDGTGTTSQVQFAQLSQGLTFTPFNIIVNPAKGSGSSSGTNEADNDYIIGSKKSDRINAGNGNDIVFGRDSNDTLKGGAGIDGLYGDDGNDFLYGEEGIDYLYGATGNDYLKGGTGDDFLADDAGNDTLDGGDGDDFLDPGPGNDLLLGGAGNDIITGGAGKYADTLFGGAGKDAFSFVEPGQGIDTIGDFNVTEDAIVVTASGFGGGLTSGVVLPFQFVLGNTTNTTEQRFIYNDITGGLFFDADGTGASAQVQFAQLASNLAFTSFNIVVR
ncbi:MULTISPECIES: calcium-binding protein [Nostoc]|uniref:Calcium-binding protein n=1 Tax=Nostoc paludosum FACHB-159 TaxID=2692908 RepID=A0ABR8KK15_9NOSO|nr:MULTISPECIES: calcium-binding protein [Nostoc]MBD2682710.1 hypothetical protein [Nostoc sp. FACHB-857]MBD2739044.1 hypothetical protein [Nostoc paludosum FACHB-159]